MISSKESYMLTFCELFFSFSAPTESHYNVSLQQSANGGGGVIHQKQPSFRMMGSMIRVASLPPVMSASRAQFPPVGVSVYETVLPASVGFIKHSEADVMPLAQYLHDGHHKPAAWHRSEERQARGLPPCYDTDLEEWERELAWMEMMVLSGSCQATFAHLARAWGRDDGLGNVLSQFLGQPQQEEAVQQQQPDAALSSVSSAIVNNNNHNNNHNSHNHPAKVSKHLRVSTMDVAFSWNQEDEQLAAGMFEDNDFSFDNLEDEIEVLSSSGDDESSDGENSSIGVCQPCNNGSVAV